KVIARLRDHARAFFAALAASHRARADDEREERVRATAESLLKTEGAAANLAGALDHVEAVVALSARGGAGAGGTADAGEEDPERAADDRATLTRRAGQIRDELRFLVRAVDPSFVHFVEFRGKGIFLRAAPIDVSSIVRELLVDRLRTTVLTSATLTVDGSFDY